MKIIIDALGRELCKRTFHSKRGGARRFSIIILGLAAVDDRVLWEDFKQQQCVLVTVVEELALVAESQSLGVLVPGHLGPREAAHLH